MKIILKTDTILRQSKSLSKNNYKYLYKDKNIIHTFIKINKNVSILYIISFLYNYIIILLYLVKSFLSFKVF